MNAATQSFFICLAASLLWAPAVFLLTRLVIQNGGQYLSDKVWPGALAIAVLPALFAPFAASLGFSLRAAPSLPPMTTDAAHAAPIMVETARLAAPTSAFDMATALNAAAWLYFYGLGLYALVCLTQLAAFSYRLRYAEDATEPALIQGLEAWRRRMAIARRPRYALCDDATSVCVHGFIRPVIIFPRALLSRIAIEDAILMGAHELAHIKRHDAALFALCAMAKSIFWFNPFIYRLVAHVRLSAEQAADALVISSGVERHRYARCFIQSLRYSAGAATRTQAIALSLTPFGRASRRARLDAILDGGSGAISMNRLQYGSMLAAMIGAASLALAQAAFAVAPESDKSVLPVTPTEGPITLGFDDENIVLGEDAPRHQGLDIKAARGTVVKASGAGKIIDATDNYRGQRAWGKVVVIDHGHGLLTRYAHLDSIIVRKGESVAAGDVIGAVGSTGKSTGPHLHFEVIRDGAPVDPASFLFDEPPTPASAPNPPTPAPSRDVIEPVVPTPVSPPPGVIELIGFAPEGVEADASLNVEIVEWNSLSHEERRAIEKKTEKAHKAIIIAEKDMAAARSEVDARLAEIRVEREGLGEVHTELNIADSENDDDQHVIVKKHLSEQDRMRMEKEALKEARQALREHKKDLERELKALERRQKEIEKELKRAHADQD